MIDECLEVYAGWMVGGLWLINDPRFSDWRMRLGIYGWWMIGGSLFKNARKFMVDEWSEVYGWWMVGDFLIDEWWEVYGNWDKNLLKTLCHDFLNLVW